MTNFTIEKFNIVGIAVRTTNENGQAGQDIPALWHQFLSEGIMDKIAHKVDSNIYCIYTEYEKDYTRPYTALLGCKVAHLDNIPTGLTGKTFDGGTYTCFTAKGSLSEGAVFSEWNKIWQSDIPRAYTADLEIYGEKSLNSHDAEVDIWIAIDSKKA